MAEPGFEAGQPGPRIHALNYQTASYPRKLCSPLNQTLKNAAHGGSRKHVDEEGMPGTVIHSVIGPQGLVPFPSAVVVGCGGTHRAVRTTPSGQ